MNMATSATKPNIEICMRRLAERPQGKRYGSEDDIRIQVIHDLNARVAVKQELLGLASLGKDERSFEEGWRDGLSALVGYFSAANPVLSRDRGLFRPRPLTVEDFNRQLLALMEAAEVHAESVLGYPAQNVIRGSYYLESNRTHLRPGAYYINAVREGSKEIWADLSFQDEHGSRGGSWDSVKQFLRYVDATPRLVTFMKTQYVHDSHEYQYRAGWRAGVGEMTYLAKVRRSVSLPPQG